MCSWLKGTNLCPGLPGSIIRNLRFIIVLFVIRFNFVVFGSSSLLHKEVLRRFASKNKVNTKFMTRMRHLLSVYFLASFGLFAPYLERACLLLATPAVSSVPLMMWYLVPGRSFTLPPRIITTLCSCRLCPSPGM